MLVTSINKYSFTIDFEEEILFIAVIVCAILLRLNKK